MCFNAPVSITTFLIGIIGSIRLYKLNFKAEALFYSWVVLMQLVEYFLWKNQPCNDTNLIVTNAGMLINHLEPIALWIGIILFSEKQLPLPINIILLLYLFITIQYTRTYFQKNKLKCTSPTPESSPHLHWKWNYGKHYQYYYSFFLICLVLLSLYGLKNGSINAFLLVASYLLSYVIYGDKHSVGAMWCLFAAFVPWIIPYLNDLI